MIFEVAFNFLLSHEGGYVDDPFDKGGATKYGISSRFLRVNEIGVKDVKDLTILQAKQIYHVFFWDPLKIDRINDSFVQLFLFDTAVNCGKEKAVLLLQNSINSISHIAVDGIIGNETINTCNNITSSASNNKLLRQLLSSSRLSLYMHIVNSDETQRKFFKGWVARTNDIFAGT